MAGPGGALDPLVGDQVEVTLQVKSEVRVTTDLLLTSVGWLMPWSMTVPARALPFLYWLLSAGKNLNISVNTEEERQTDLV